MKRVLIIEIPDPDFQGQFKRIKVDVDKVTEEKQKFDFLEIRWAPSELRVNPQPVKPIVPVPDLWNTHNDDALGKLLAALLFKKLGSTFSSFPNAKSRGVDSGADGKITFDSRSYNVEVKISRIGSQRGYARWSFSGIRPKSFDLVVLFALHIPVTNDNSNEKLLQIIQRSASYRMPEKTDTVEQLLMKCTVFLESRGSQPWDELQPDKDAKGLTLTPYKNSSGQGNRSDAKLTLTPFDVTTECRELKKQLVDVCNKNV
jgi:hypothetical protein